MDCDTHSSGSAGRAASPTFSDVSELTVFSRSPSPVRDYGRDARRIGSTLPLTPPSTPQPTRAVKSRFTLREGKRSGSPNVSSPSKKPRSAREPRGPDNPTSPASPQSPRTPRSSTRRYFKDAVPPSPKSILPRATPWVAGKGGCGALETLPKEIRQVIYGLAFDTNAPVTVRECCGPNSTIRERRACRKHGSRTVAQAGRFNILLISQGMRIEAMWAVMSRGWLLLKVASPLIQYLGCYRWNTQRPLMKAALENKRKTTMWASAGRFRHVEIVLTKETIAFEDPVLYTGHLVEVASSLCQSWTHLASTNMLAADGDSKRHASINLRSLFQDVLHLNNASQPHHFHTYFSLERDLNFGELAADSGQNLIQLIAAIVKYRGSSEWKFVADTWVEEDHGCSVGWLHRIQAECAKHGMLLEHIDCAWVP